MAFKPFGLEERAPIPDSVRKDGFKSFGTKGFPGPYYNSAIFEASQDHVLGTQAQVTLGQATCYYAATADFRDKDNSVVTFVAYDRINIVIDQMERDIVFPAVKLEFLAHSLVDMKGYDITIAGECGGRIELTDTGTTGNFLNISSQSNGLKIKDGFKFTYADTHNQGGSYRSVWSDGAFVYVANSTLGLLSYSVSATGVLTYLDGDIQGGAGNYNWVWGDGNFIYVGTSGAGLLSYSVDGAGILTFVDSDLNAPSGTYDAVWGDGSYIYVASSAGGLLSYSVDISGILTYVDGDLQAGAGQYEKVWGDGTFIYVTSINAGLMSYESNGSGILTFKDSDIQVGAGTHAGVWGDSNFLYTVSTGLGLMTYSVDSGGILTYIDNDLQGGVGFYFDVHGDGKYIFASTATLGVMVYVKTTAGILTFIESKKNAGTSYRGIWSDNDFIYIVDSSGAEGISTFSLQSLNRYVLNFTGSGSYFADGILTT